MIRRKYLLLAMIGAVVVTVAAIGVNASLTGSASAASGGGCKDGIDPEHPWVLARSCISSNEYSIGRSDAYITLQSGHPSCSISIVVVRQSDSTIVSRAHYHCPSGSVSGKRYPAPSFRAYSGTYFTVVQVSGATNLRAYSPSLTLP